MKTAYKSLLAAALLAPVFSSCIEETFPTSGVVQGQLEASATATAALVWNLPGNMLTINTVSDNQHYNFGFPAMMHAMDCMTGDMVVDYNGGYDWFSSWGSVRYSLGQDYMVCQFMWNYYYAQILACNNVVRAIDPETESAELRASLAQGLTYRAMIYLTAAQGYEVLPTSVNDGLSTAGQPLIGLTLPIVTEKTTEEEARNNPRVSHEDMYEFIKGDLDQAIELFNGAAGRSSKVLPNLAVAYGIYARLEMWNAGYEVEINGAAPSVYSEAAKYARLAINASGATPLNESEWTSTTQGFNDDSMSSWMLALEQVKENDCVQTGIVNWVSFCANEAIFGYTGAGTFVNIDANLYNSINDRDFRKYSYVPGEGSNLASRIKYINTEWAEENLHEYSSVKIRPGEGNMDDNNIAAASDIPLMRVEEMYLIEAEATAHSDAAAGKALLESFMKTYRYPTYTCKATTSEGVVDECFLQKRIELWGEGLIFFDYKRLNKSVTRWYNGSNWDPTLNAYNTDGRPSWMNFVITRQELDNNTALVNYQTPDPYQNYSLPK
ncbi:MAG: RagB/SusD family nutrient uptake outer membrane protein [Bacteroidales bacterium]|nr:RagB/SusD family nutrient uptake outer membrane protein [Bacteroidales bacterium]